MAYLGLDWSNEEVDSFLHSRGSCSLLQFMSTFVRIIEEVRPFPGLRSCAAPVEDCSRASALQGAVTGTKTLTVRNWFPGMWYVRERKRSGAGTLHLFCQTETGGWTDSGQVRCCQHGRSFRIAHCSCDGRLPCTGHFGCGTLGAAVPPGTAHD